MAVSVAKALQLVRPPVSFQPAHLASSETKCYTPFVGSFLMSGVESSSSLSRQCIYARPEESKGSTSGSRTRVKGVQCSAVAETAASSSEAAKSTAHTIRIHYYRKDSSYTGWGLHVWGSAVKSTGWDQPLLPAGKDEYGVYFEVDTMPGQGPLEYIIHAGDSKDNVGSLSEAVGSEVWLVSGRPGSFKEEPDLASLPEGDLQKAKALWITRDIIAWNLSPQGENGLERSFYLHACREAQLKLTGQGIIGGVEPIPLTIDATGLTEELLAKFPYVKDYTVLRVPAGTDYDFLLKGQVAVSAVEGVKAIDATGVQLPGVLDDLYAYDGPLGVTFTEDSVQLIVWAPSAQSVRLLLFGKAKGDEAAQTLPMAADKGVWSITGNRQQWDGKYFLYEVTVFSPWTNKIEKSFSTDPYSRSLSANGLRSQITDITSASCKPEQWENLLQEKKPLESFADVAIYELHIRDFSAADESVSAEVRGTYLAFTEKESNGVKHLKSLAEAGLSHLHLLPAFDFGSVNEDKATWRGPEGDLASFPPDSEEQQAAVMAVANQDAFNWGYDPVHYGVPDGSYATNPDGPTRTLEFRRMVQAINRLGLRVVLDVVYNHLNAAGPFNAQSTFDKIVPGYYLRRNAEGEIENSTCMNNTASEHYMFSRFVVDDLKHWAINYKVDGFRFDLMGHLMKSTMEKARDALCSLTVEEHGVDGSKILLYGEGWDFGEVSGNARGVNACQLNLAHTGIASFNDRIRDAIMGGSPFGDIQLQGFATGLFLNPNALDQGNGEQQERALRATTDWIRLGLVGNLRDYVLRSSNGEEVKGGELKGSGGAPVGYTASPTELINYASAHDNETLFDVIMLKVPRETSLEARCRINHLATALIALSQGIPFFHAGDDTLRSKSLDRDSYNSGDWFNKLDFTYESNNFGVGLPPKEKNEDKWPFMRSLLADPAMKPRKEHILAARANLLELLAIRFSSPLFRLTSAAAVQERVEFLNAGPEGAPAVIIMGIKDKSESSPGLDQLCDKFRRVVVVFNAQPTDLMHEVAALGNSMLSLHPVQASSADPVMKRALFENGRFTVPAHTAAVFVDPRS